MKVAENAYFENQPKSAPKRSTTATAPQEAKAKKRLRVPVQAIAWDKVRRVAALCLMLGAVFLLVALLGHIFFSGEADQSVVLEGRGNAENQGGYFGAYLANRFITNGFGYAIFFTPFYLFFVGLGLWDHPKRWAVVLAIFPHYFFWSYWLSMTFAFVARVLWNSALDPGGAIGLSLVEWWAIYVGDFGVGLTLILTLTVFSILKYNLQLADLLGKLPSGATTNRWFDKIQAKLKRGKKQTVPASTMPATPPDPEPELVISVRKAPEAPKPPTTAPLAAVDATAVTGQPVSEKKKSIQLNLKVTPPVHHPLQTTQKPATAEAVEILDTTAEQIAIVFAEEATLAETLALEPEAQIETMALNLPDETVFTTLAETLKPNPTTTPKAPRNKTSADIEMEVVVPQAEARIEAEPQLNIQPIADFLPFSIDVETLPTTPALPTDTLITIPIEPAADNLIEIETEKFVRVILPEDAEALEANEDVGEWEAYDPTKDLSDYQYPTLDLLKQYESPQTKEVNRQELENNKTQIITTLRNYGIEITSIKATIGPTVTLYEIVPAPGIRISKIKNLEDDIALSLAALGIRIIAPMPGKGTIGIEIPNSQPEIVSFRSVIATERFRDSDAALPIAIGRTISNEVYIADLAKMPHLLVAGATGQGKSVGLNCIIASLLYKKHPAQVKFVLIDPKKVEMTLYQLLERHFLAKLPGYEDAIITDNKQVMMVLSSLCVEMDNRYLKLQEARVRNITEYNAKFTARKLNPQKGHCYLPYIVLIIDELADLIMTAGKEIETPIARLAQLARAVGIHLVVATQRPSVNVITGTIKANFPARLSYRVISKMDSRTILDSNGADQLIGRGDLLLFTGSELIRIQNAYVDTPEVEKLVEFIAVQRGYPEPYYLPEVPNENNDARQEEAEDQERDPLFAEAARLIVSLQQGSTSVIQRRMKLGFNRAGRIMDQLEAAGIVGPQHGSKPREVFVKTEADLILYL